MTFKEKWEQDHPDKDFIKEEVVKSCPECYLYEAFQNRDCDNITCENCWDREMPPTYNFEFNVGSFVETTEGHTGYIDIVEDTSYKDVFISVIFKGNIRVAYKASIVYMPDHAPQYHAVMQSESSIEYANLKRIGQHSLLNEKTKIKPLPFLKDMEDASIVDLRCKVNEIIEYINKIDESK